MVDFNIVGLLIFVLLTVPKISYWKSKSTEKFVTIILIFKSHARHFSVVPVMDLFIFFVIF